jgi:uncharacterized protein YbjT (DUF2867 family)
VRALVTGATGYVGSRLVPALLDAGVEVVAAVRAPERLAGVPWRAQVDVVPLDLLDDRSTRAALRAAGRDAPIDVAYYLVHALGEGDYAELDARAATGFAGAAARAGLPRIVYLGGFLPEDVTGGPEVSRHLRSRAQVGDLLAERVDTVVLQAAAILGRGSTPFELVRHLVDLLPVVPLPPFMRQRVQPIAIDDVLHYLVAAAGRDRLPAGRYEISGDRDTTYTGLVRTYADIACRRRVFVPVPFLTAAAAASVIGPITAVDGALVTDLMESLSTPMVSTERRIRDYVPDPLGGLLGITEGMVRAVHGA